MTDDCGCSPWHLKCWHIAKWFSFSSLTVSWTYLMFVGSALMELLFQIPDLANEFGLHDYVPPRWLPWYTAAMALITLMARLRSILWRQDYLETRVREVTDPEVPDARVPDQHS